MKNIFTILFSLLLFTSVISNAQTLVPNANMESWANLGSYKEPTGWGSPNSLTSLLGVYECFQSTDANSGTYAAQLKANYVALLGLVVPGVIGTGTIDAATQTVKGGFPISVTPAAVIGYYKYTPTGSDSCLVYSILTKWNSGLNKRDTLAVAAFIGGAASSYTMFTAPFYTLGAGTPDSALVLVATTNDVATAQDGSTMYIDDIDFTVNLGINPIPEIELGIYPNPANQLLQITIPLGINAETIVISSVAGMKANQYNVTSGVFELNTSSLANGIYFTMMKNSEGKVVASGKFTVQH
jgi:hypothetical protein